MAKRVSTSASRSPWASKRLVLALTAAALMACGGMAHQAVRGRGEWHEMAVGVYHHWRDWQTQRAYAAEVPLERAEAPLTVYQRGLGEGWGDWSWATHTLGRNAPISMIPEANKGIYLHHAFLGTSGYGSLLVAAARPGRLTVSLVDGTGNFLKSVPLQEYGTPAQIPLADLGVPRYGGAITGVVLQAGAQKPQPVVSIERIALLPDTSLPPAPTQATVAVAVDVRAARRPISPLIYGTAFAPPAALTDLRVPVNRWGGNDKSRYNWVQGNASSAAADWRFANKPASDLALTPGPSSAADAFVRQDRAAGAATLLTVPTLGWVARDADNAHASQNVPPQGGAPLSGPDGPIAGYDPAGNRLLTSVRSVARKGAPFVDSPPPGGRVVYQDEWVHHLIRTFGPAARGGVRLYAMDNEPDLWDSTHRDVHPARVGYDDMLGNFLDYATAVKAVDPTAWVTGPVISGWTGYEYSALDRGDDNFHTNADQRRHGGEWFLPWFLHRVRDHDRETGRRTLDVLDVHFYPQGQGLFGGQTDPDAQARRLRATRSLWDPDYTDESWIGQPVRLIPRLREWVAQNYPGTRLGITEWNFGADDTMNGGLAVADVLGIFGREGVYLANYWACPGKDSPGYLAFKLYRNADGRGQGFGDQSVEAVSADPNRLAAYAATDTRTGDLTLMLINKMPKATVTAPITLRGMSGTGGTVKMWRVSADNAKQIVALPVRALAGPGVTTTLPPYSITLLRIPMKGGSR